MGLKKPKAMNRTGVDRNAYQDKVGQGADVSYDRPGAFDAALAESSKGPSANASAQKERFTVEQAGPEMYKDSHTGSMAENVGKQAAPSDWATDNKQRFKTTPAQPESSGARPSAFKI